METYVIKKDKWAVFYLVVVPMVSLLLACRNVVEPDDLSPRPAIEPSSSEAPILIEPKPNKQYTNQYEARLRWSWVEGFMSYEAVVAHDRSFNNVAFQAIVMNSNRVWTNSLARGQYYWRVRALASNGTPRPWSQIGSFAILGSITGG